MEKDQLSRIEALLMVIADELYIQRHDAKNGTYADSVWDKTGRALLEKRIEHMRDEAGI